MREYTNRHIVANIIRMARVKFTGSFLIVEGDKDARLYKNFVDNDKCRIIPAHSKDNAVGALSILEQRHFAGVLAIVDADFAVLEGQLPTSPNLLFTDTHDLETMILKSPALEKILIEYGSEEKLAAFTRQRGMDIRQLLINSAIPIGYLRWISSREKLSLSFKELEFTKFINIDELTIDVSKFVTIVKERSQKPDILDDNIIAKIAKLRNGTHDYWHICCGHDLVCILSIGLSKAIGSWNINNVRQYTIERALRLAFESSYFSRTQLYSSIINWEKANEPFLILGADN